MDGCFTDEGSTAVGADVDAGGGEGRSLVG